MKELVKVFDMNGRRAAALAFGLAIVVGGQQVFAVEPTVQEFDGWRIVIQPGDYPSASSQNDFVPPAPKDFGVARSTKNGSVRQVSFLQEASETLPPPPAPAPEAQADGLPVITPGTSSSCPNPTAGDPASGKADPVQLARLYAEVYDAIPFNRAEYNANSSYRHEAAMEILFGQLRPTVVHKGTVRVYGPSPMGYVYPPLQLIVPGVGLRIHRSE